MLKKNSFLQIFSFHHDGYCYEFSTKDYQFTKESIQDSRNFSLDFKDQNKFVNISSSLSDFGPRQIENAAMLCSSWQRPPMMIDPNGEGSVWLGKLNKLMNKKKLVSLDMETRCVRAN